MASQPCLVCGRQPSDPHHLRFAQPRAIGLKVSDEFTVPLCRGHHRQLHQTGNEVAWWEDLRINSLEIARSLWEQTHPASALSISCRQRANQELIRRARTVASRPEMNSGQPTYFFGRVSNSRRVHGARVAHRGATEWKLPGTAPARGKWSSFGSSSNRYADVRFSGVKRTWLPHRKMSAMTQSRTLTWRSAGL